MVHAQKLRHSTLHQKKTASNSVEHLPRQMDRICMIHAVWTEERSTTTSHACMTGVIIFKGLGAATFSLAHLFRILCLSAYKSSNDHNSKHYEVHFRRVHPGSEICQAFPGCEYSFLDKERAL
jgi:hypothetical protein